MLQLAFKVAADKPSTRKITVVQQEGYPDDVITFGDGIVARGENLEGCTALKLELYEGGEPVAVLDRLQDVMTLPTLIAFSNATNTSGRPNEDWYGKQVLLTATFGDEEVRHWVRFYDPAPTITSAHSKNSADGHVNCGGEDLIVEGTNLDTATQVELLDDGDSVFRTVAATYADGKLTAYVSVESYPPNGSVRVTTAGGSAKYAVTYDNH